MPEKKNQYIDIHCHILPEVDDGARNLEESLAMLRQEVKQGVEAVILTPHQLTSDFTAAVRFSAAWTP